MDDLKLLLIDRLKSKGMDPSLIPAFLRAAMNILAWEPRIDPAQVNQKLHALGWNEIVFDFHSQQIAIACLEAEMKTKHE